jgi:hypothetical protein
MTPAAAPAGVMLPAASTRPCAWRTWSGYVEKTWLPFVRYVGVPKPSRNQPPGAETEICSTP